MESPAGTLRSELSRFVGIVRREYWSRPFYDELGDGARQANTTRVVACQILEGLPRAQRTAIVAELHDLDRMTLMGDPVDLFCTASTPAEVLFDLVCEVCWQELVGDHAIRVEDELRAILAEA